MGIYDEADRRAEALAAGQHGLLRHDQALDLGFTVRRIQRRVESRRWLPADRHVYRMPGSPATFRSRALATVWALEGAASHWTAGVLWDLGVVQGTRPHVIVSHRKYLRRTDVVVHRYSQFDIVGATILDGIPVTDAATTVFDLCGVLDVVRATTVLDTARRKGLVTWDDFADTFDRLRRRGRNGSANARAILEHHFGEKAIPDSATNRRIAIAFADAGIVPPIAEHTVTLPDGARVRFDLAWPDLLLAAEIQTVWHENEAAMVRDAKKAGDAALLGWRVLPISSAEFRDDPSRVIDRWRGILGVVMHADDRVGGANAIIWGGRG